jgi:acetyl esterase/lipase
LIFGSAEVLRDETVAFASKLWASGVQAELHVWARGFHGFDMFHQDAAVSQAAKKTKMAWVKRIFGVEER